MDSAELRAVQQPLKDAYREHPEQAVVTLRAEGQLDDQGISCSVATGQALAVAGLHPATGGDGSLACSGDMLLQALVACAGVTLRAVATSLGIDVTGGMLGKVRQMLDVVQRYPAIEARIFSGAVRGNVQRLLIDPAAPIGTAIRFSM